MRTRNKTTPPNISTGGTVYTSATKKTVNGTAYPRQAAGSSPTVDLGAETSVITDDLSPSRGTKLVDHESVLYNLINPTSVVEETADTSYTYDGPNVHWWSWGNYGALSSANIAVSYPQSVPALRSQAVHAFMNANEVDSLLNIIESPQLIGSVRSLKDLVFRAQNGKLGDALRFIGAPKNTKKGSKTLKATDISNLYLMWQFGFAPLISDMRKVMKSVKTIKLDMDRAVRRAGKPYSTVAASNGSLSLVNLGGFSGYSATEPGTPNGTYWHPSLVGYAHRRVGVRGIRTHSYNSSTFQKLDYLMNRFLSPGPISLVWERIPFSFVVDWFVDLSGIVDTLNNTLTGSTRKVNDCWESEKMVAQINVYKHRTSAWSTSLDGSVTRSLKVVKYHRGPLEHVNSTSFSGRFGKKQALLSSALLHQLVANLRR